MKVLLFNEAIALIFNKRRIAIIFDKSKNYDLCFLQQDFSASLRSKSYKCLGSRPKRLITLSIKTSLVC